MVDHFYFLIKWYGPFNSKEDLKEWELKQKESFTFYLFQGKKTWEQEFNYYCGSTRDRDNNVTCVFRRLRDPKHHIHQYEKGGQNSLFIWIGTVDNIHPFKSDEIFCEYMFIREMPQFKIEDNSVNHGVHIFSSKKNVYIINEWYNKERDEYRPISKDYIPNIVPDVIKFNALENYLCSSRF